MGDTEEAHSEMMHHNMQSSFGSSLSSSASIMKQPLSMEQLSVPQFNSPMRVRHFQQQNFSGDGNGNRRIGIPPSHPHQIPPISPYSQIPVSRQSVSPGGQPTH